jgi:GTPase SAR1 family protein
VASKWVAEITEHCQGVKVVLVALKCDLREEHEKEDDGPEDATDAPAKQVIQYQEGLDVARKIGALRYLGTWIASHHTFKVIREMQGIRTNILASQNAPLCGTAASMKPSPRPPELRYRSNLPNRKPAAAPDAP